MLMVRIKGLFVTGWLRVKSFKGREEKKRVFVEGSRAFNAHVAAGGVELQDTNRIGKAMCVSHSVSGHSCPKTGKRKHGSDGVVPGVLSTALDVDGGDTSLLGPAGMQVLALREFAAMSLREHAALPSAFIRDQKRQTQANLDTAPLVNK